MENSCLIVMHRKQTAARYLGNQLVQPGEGAAAQSFIVEQRSQVGRVSTEHTVLHLNLELSDRETQVCKTIRHKVCSLHQTPLTFTLI